MKRRRILAMLTVSAMTVSMIGGCSSSGSDSQTTGSGESAQTSQASSEAAGETEAAEMTTITVWNNAAHETTIRENRLKNSITVKAKNWEFILIIKHTVIIMQIQ